MVARVACMFAIALAGCFDPALPDGAFTCDDDRGCPPGFACAADGRCRSGAPGDLAVAPADAAADLARPADLAPAVDLARPADLCSADATDGCAALTCMQLAASCGSWPNGCGGMIFCGYCPYGTHCDGGKRKCIN